MSIVKLLVSHGADLKITDHTGTAPNCLYTDVCLYTVQGVSSYKVVAQ